MSKTGKGKRKKRTAPTPEDIIAWAEMKAGVPRAKIAEKMKCGTRTVSAKKKFVDEYVGQKFDVTEIRTALLGFTPLALESLKSNLQDNDVAMTIAYLKGIAAFVDKLQAEVSDASSIANDDLYAKLREIGVLATGSAQEGVGIPPNPVVSADERTLLDVPPDGATKQ